MLSTPEGHARIGPIRQLPGLLADQGVDPAPVLRRAGVGPDLFDDPHGTIPYPQLGTLLHEAAQAARSPHFGMMVGATCGIENLGLPGTIAAQAPNLGQALQDIVEHVPDHYRASSVSVTVEADLAVFQFSLLADVPGAEFIREGSVAIMVRVIRDLCGANWAPDRVRLAHRRTGPASPYAAYFRAPVAFNTGENAVIFPAAMLARAFPGRQPGDRHALKQEARRATTRHGALADRVRHQIAEGLPRARADEISVARALAMDRSTLRRHLAREGTTFRAISHEVHFAHARHLIRDTDLSLADIASLLGYAEPAVFTRAFRRWSGMSPSDWRKAE